MEIQTVQDFLDFLSKYEKNTHVKLWVYDFDKWKTVDVEEHKDKEGILFLGLE